VDFNVITRNEFEFVMVSTIENNNKALTLADLDWFSLSMEGLENAKFLEQKGAEDAYREDINDMMRTMMYLERDNKLQEVSDYGLNYEIITEEEAVNMSVGWIRSKGVSSGILKHIDGSQYCDGHYYLRELYLLMDVKISSIMDGHAETVLKEIMNEYVHKKYLEVTSENDVNEFL
jgi:hypothetical protein